MNICCPVCGTSIEVSKFLVGQKGRCPNCASKFIIPESADDEIELLEKGEIPKEAPAPVEPPKSESKPDPEPEPEKQKKESAPPKVSTKARTVVPATGGAAPARMPARPMVVKQSSGAFGFLFAIVLAALVGVVVYVWMDMNKQDPAVAQKPVENEDPKPAEPVRPVQPVIPVQPDEPEFEEGFPVYAKVIQPVLEAKCTSCHGEEKRKGRLAMHTYEELAAGGGNGSILEPDADDKTRIEFLFRAELPEDDEEHMPPKGKPQLTAEELSVLKWWIKEGAYEDIENTEAPDELRKTIDELAKL